MSDEANENLPEIRTSSPGWLVSLAKAYKVKAAVLLIDDAGIGVDPIRDTLFDMARKAKLSAREWVAVLVSVGVGLLGAWMIVLAILDPEPYSKVASTVAAGTVLVLGGGGMAVRVLVGHKPPNVKVSPGGFEIRWE